MSNYKNLKNISIDHISEWRNTNKTTNCHVLNLDGDLIVFSYSTIIAVMKDYQWYIVDPSTAPKETKINSQTTRQHINLINDDKSIRIPYDDFQQLLVDTKIKLV